MVFSAVLLGLALWEPVAHAEALSECYRTAENRVQVRQCLQRELDETQKAYAGVVDRLAGELRRLDAASGDRREKTRGSAGPASQAFAEANRAFDSYRRKQCLFEGAALGSGTGAGNQEIACRINLMHLRMGSLKGFLGGDSSVAAPQP